MSVSVSTLSVSVRKISVSVRRISVSVCIESVSVRVSIYVTIPLYYNQKLMNSFIVLEFYLYPFFQCTLNATTCASIREQINSITIIFIQDTLFELHLADLSEISEFQYIFYRHYIEQSIHNYQQK